LPSRPKAIPECFAPRYDVCPVGRETIVASILRAEVIGRSVLILSLVRTKGCGTTCLTVVEKEGLVGRPRPEWITGGTAP
jgi:hypothetical protein